MEIQPNEQRYALSWQQRRIHCIRVAAYLLSQERQHDGTPGTPEEDWLVAEWEYDNACYGNWKFRMENNAETNERIRYAVLYCTASELRPRTGYVVCGDTPLPQDRRRLERICAAVARAARCHRFAVPENISTVGELTDALLRTPRIMRR